MKPLIHSVKFLSLELLRISVNLPSDFPWIVRTGTHPFYLDMLNEQKKWVWAVRATRAAFLESLGHLQIVAGIKLELESCYC